MPGSNSAVCTPHNPCGGVLAPDVSTPENALLEAGRQKKIRAVLAEASKTPTDSEILQLRMKGYKAKEIGEKLGLTERAVLQRLYLIRKKLKTKGNSLSDLINEEKKE